MDKVDYEAKLAAELESLQKYYASLEDELRSTASEATDGEPELVPSEVSRRMSKNYCELLTLLRIRSSNLSNMQRRKPRSLMLLST